MSTSRIVANQSHLTRAIALYNRKIRLFVRNEPHESGLNTLELAKRLSQGYVQDETGIEVPARPFMKQFFAEHKTMITAAIKESGVWKLKGAKADSAWDQVANYLLDEFRNWMIGGGITPANAPYTVKQKGSSAPLVHHGQLLAAISVEATSAPVK